MFLSFGFSYCLVGRFRKRFEGRLKTNHACFQTTFYCYSEIFTAVF
ncbi:hypothetical protein NEIMUCOT_03797 [Neisseria mucosa ATCC 25996]|uniref:Uncharacterized protein n=1 Tax=Neisseria mucosa (strain ATCC 25996 / DSM 4631 / NCTC 10774 / M26) TaxID=546266 RepID=D2ZT60_NEIM2|nr:hypothetical protein NEIMUCOT_03797 [Neisseria mucosa ATCC 25996]